MHRRDVLRQSGVAMTVAVTAGLAGCSGNDGDSDDGGDEPTPTPSGPTGEVVENSVSNGLEITDWTTEVADGDFNITLTVKNVGDQQTDAFDYTYEATVYNSADEDITASVASGSRGSTIDPGQTTEINMYVGVSNEDPSAVSRFELRVRCDDFFDEGVYCGNSDS